MDAVTRDLIDQAKAMLRIFSDKPHPSLWQRHASEFGLKVMVFAVAVCGLIYTTVSHFR